MISGCRLALDLGTTNLVGRLCDASGSQLAETSLPNPQQTLGADILTRLKAAHEGDGPKLQAMLVEGLRRLVEKLCREATVSPRSITTAAAAGNPGMSCLLRKFPVHSLLFPPHKPTWTELASLPSEVVDLGLQIPLQVFPPISGFVGGDLVSVLMPLQEVAPGTLVIDIGTNGELALWDGDRWWVSSVAAGPALEGGNISSGMALQVGAVSAVRVADDRLQLSVVGDRRPIGLCGSGLLALVSTALQMGLVDMSGRIVSPDEVADNGSRYLVRQNDGWAIRFYHDATGDLRLTQDDLRNVQLAKGAVFAGALVLCEHAGFGVEDISSVLITGALGVSQPKSVLKRVALLPVAMVDKTRFAGNAVLSGLQSYLQADGPRRLEVLLGQLQPFPLSGTPAFEQRFLASLNFHETAE